MTDSAAEPGPSDPLADTGIPSAFPADEPFDGKPLKLSKKPLGDVIRGLVLAGSTVLHGQLARHDYEREQGLWLATEDEAGAIADPLARIAQRRAGGALVDADTSDVIAAAVAAAGYVLRNATNAVRIRMALRQMRRAGLETEAGHPDEQEHTE